MIVKLPATQLKIGMYIERYGDGSFDAPVVHYKKMVENQDELDRLMDMNLRSLFIDTDKSKKILAKAKDTSGFKSKSASLLQKTSFSEEILIARKAYLKALNAVKDIFAQARKAENIDTSVLAEPAEDICQSVSKNINAATSLTTLKTLGEYTITHSVNVGILSAAFGTYLGLPEKLVKDLAIAGMLHDIGKVSIKRDILIKPGRLTPSEFDHIKQHPLLGYNLIRENNDLNSQVLRGILEHHERFDGSGYPEDFPV